MALCRFSSSFRYKIYKDSQYVFCYLIHRHTTKTSNRNIHKTDAIETYTEHLLQENTNKWNDVFTKLFIKKSVLVEKNNVTHQSELLKLSKEELESKIIDNVVHYNMNNVIELVTFCKNNSHNLSCDFMLYLVKVFAKSGHKEGVKLVLSLYESVNNNDFKENCGFEYYNAQVLWYNGRIEQSFEILERLYLVNKLKPNVNSIMYDIINNAVIKNEAVLVLTTNFIQRLFDTYHNSYPLSLLWKTLTISDYFADQQLAKELLVKNEELKIIISPLIPLWCVQLIQYHKIDAIHRMCEVLLELERFEHYSSVLHTLFDYYYNLGSLKRCSAIVKSAIDLDLPLKQSYQQRFLSLLITGKPELLKRKFTKKHNQIDLKF